MRAAAILSLLLLAAPLGAMAQADPLDLKLKDNASFPDADPPGAYYGDHSGPAPKDDGHARSQLDDGRAHLHGSFTTGMGYSTGYGSSTYNAADLSIGKAFTSEQGRTSVMRMDIHVSKRDGPGHGPYGDDGYDGWPGPHAAGGASMRGSQDSAL